MAGRAKAAPDDKAAAPAPVEPVTAPPEPVNADEAPGLVLPDDTHDEGHQDPIAKISELETPPRPDAGAGRQPAAAGHRGRLHRRRILRHAGQWLRDHPRPGERLLPAIRGPVRLGVPGRSAGHSPSTHAASRRISARPPAPSRAYDTIHSGGAPSFIANEINLTLTAGLTPSAVATASINFMPRSGSNFSLGDVLDADIAQLEWMPTRSQKTSIFVGKFDSVLGIEYRDRKSNQRYGITPVAHRALHDRHGGRGEGPLQVRSRRSPGRRRRRHQRVVHPGAVPLLRRDRHQPRQDGQRPDLLAPTHSDRHGARRLGLLRLAGSLPQRPRQDVVLGRSTTSCTCHASTSRRSTSRGPPRAMRPDDVYGLRLHGGGYVEVDG